MVSLLPTMVVTGSTEFVRNKKNNPTCFACPSWIRGIGHSNRFFSGLTQRFLRIFVPSNNTSALLRVTCSCKVLLWKVFCELWVCESRTKYSLNKQNKRPMNPVDPVSTICNQSIYPKFVFTWWFSLLVCLFSFHKFNWWFGREAVSISMVEIEIHGTQKPKGLIRVPNVSGFQPFQPWFHVVRNGFLNHPQYLRVGGICKRRSSLHPAQSRSLWGRNGFSGTGAGSLLGLCQEEVERLRRRLFA